MKFSSMKLTSVRGVREYIMQMRDIVAQLKLLEVDMSETFLVHYIMNTLPQQYGPFKISYNTHKDKWSINELMTMCVQEKGKLIMEVAEGASTVTQGKNKLQAKKKGKCKKKGHMKKDCPKFQKWFEKKGKSISFVCYEFNMVDINHNTLWINFCSTIRVTNTLQGLQNLRKPMRSEQCIFFGNKMHSHVEAIRTCSLILSSGFVLVLEKTFYILSFSRNLVFSCKTCTTWFSL